MSNPVIAILRSVHIVFGAFWLGGAVSLAFLVIPWLRSARRLGEMSAAQLITVRRLLTLVAISGVIAVAAGHILYYALWQGFGLSGPGFWYAAGGQPANIAVLLTTAVAWPAASRIAALARSPANPDLVTADESSATVVRLIKRIAWATQLSAALLVCAVICMAIGRYV